MRRPDKRSIAATSRPIIDEESPLVAEEEQKFISKPFSQTLVDLQLENADRENISDDRKKMPFFSFIFYF